MAKALQRLADQNPDNEEPWGRRMADALVELCPTQISQDPDADRATVVVHTTLETLEGKDGLAELEGGVQLCPETLRRLARDCRLEYVVKTSDGVGIGIGRASRVVPAPMMRQLRYRDGTCRFPGCERRGWLHPHHIRFWKDGGPTNLENLRCQ